LSTQSKAHQNFTREQAEDALDATMKGVLPGEDRRKAGKKGGGRTRESDTALFEVDRLEQECKEYFAALKIKQDEADKAAAVASSKDRSRSKGPGSGRGGPKK